MGNSSPKVPKLGNIDDKKDKISKISGATPHYPLLLLFFATKNKGRKKGCQSFFSEGRGGGKKKGIFARIFTIVLCIFCVEKCTQMESGPRPQGDFLAKMPPKCQFCLKRPFLAHNID